MVLVLDNRCSFTFNLVQALLERGARVEIRRATEIDVDEILGLRPERILVGSGPGRPERAGCSVEVIRRIAPRVPTLGVCLGHQAIGFAFGARISRAPELVHGRTVAIDHDGEGVFRGIESPVRFTRYNSLTVLEEQLPDCLEVTARAEDGDVMGLRHREWPLEGVQFHPESILSEGGSALLANFLALESAGALRPRTRALRP